MQINIWVFSHKVVGPENVKKSEKSDVGEQSAYYQAQLPLTITYEVCCGINYAACLFLAIPIFARKLFDL